MAGWIERAAASRVARTTIAYAAGAWVAVQVIATISQPLGWPPAALRLAIVALAAGFFVAVPLAAWFDHRARRAPTVAPGSLFLASATLAASTHSAARDTPPTHTSAAADDPSVAVLAFADMSAARDQDYFCEGTAEEIINALHRLRGLRVSARAASFQFKNRVVDSREVGRLLNVRALLDGSVRKVGDRVRIAAQLIDARDGTQLWTETFDRRLEDIFAIQEEIARSTVQALRVTLLAGEATKLHRPDATSSIAAYEQYLRARQLARKEKDAEMLAAAERYRQAVRLDPDFALAHAALANTIAHLVFRQEDLREALAPEAQHAIDRAVDLAPDAAETYVALGQVHSMYKRHAAAANAFQRAMQIDPRLFDAHYYYARFCASQGQHALAAQHYELAAALQPDDFLPIVLSVQEYQAVQDADGARHAIQRAWAAIERRLAIDPDDAAAHDHGIGILFLLGRTTEAREFAERAIALRPHDSSTYYTAACGAALGHDVEQALAWLEKAVDCGFRNAEWISNDPDMNPLRDHPRFQRLLLRLA